MIHLNEMYYLIPTYIYGSSFLFIYEYNKGGKHLYLHVM